MRDVLDLSGAVQLDSFLESAGFVDRCDIDGWLGLRQESYSPNRSRGGQEWQSEERDCSRCPW